MSEINLNSGNIVKPQVKAQPEAETMGTIASANTNAPSPLFNAAPSAETCGNIASNTSSSSSSGGGTNYVC